MEIAAATRMGPVELSVSDLERSLDYWQNTVGLGLLSRDDGRASLGAGSRELIRFVEEPGARSARGYAGLYHVALLVPERRDLARWLAHAGQAQIGLEGLSDHAVSEAIYLRDPDEHGIEIYADRPREQWDGRVRELMTTRPLDVGSLFEELDEPPTAGGAVSGPGVGGSADDASSPTCELPAGTVVGHTHLCVSDVESTVRFFVDELGLELMAQLGPMAAFLAAGGYHHHVGANTWESRGAAKAPAGTARLLRATILVPDEQELERVAGRLGVEVEDGGIAVEDPSGNPLFLTV
ncbi:MAG TPA: VOC family protein [Gaiellaceae bacterium]|jgi:catechol 2,3-dioxygenase